MAATPIILVGHWQEPNGVPSSGSVTADLTVPVANGGTTYGAITRFAFLDSDGDLTLPVIANDDAGTLPGDSQWFISVAIVGSPTVSDYITVPADPAGSRKVTDAVTVDGSTTLTSATAAFGSGDVGAFLAAPGVPVGAQVASVTSSTEVVLTLPATVSASGVTVLIGASIPLSDLLPS